MILLFFIIIGIYKFFRKKIKYNVKSIYDNIYYKLRSKVDVLKSIYYLSYLRKIGIELLNNLNKNDLIYINNIKGFNKVTNLINYVPINETRIDSNDTSYTVNKGEQIVLCIRSKNGIFFDINEIIYIFIHELAHIICNEIGHTEKFYNINRFLIREASRLNIYEIINYNINPVNYCGIKINEYLF